MIRQAGKKECFISVAELVLFGPLSYPETLGEFLLVSFSSLYAIQSRSPAAMRLQMSFTSRSMWCQNFCRPLQR